MPNEHASGGISRPDAMGPRDEAKRGNGGIPANLMRTMPYTTYVGVISYAIMFASPDAAWLALALVLNEFLNAGLKKLLTTVLSPEAHILRRPHGAIDSGIYPQHFPTESTTSGMPSGHSQAAALCATLLTLEVQGPSAEADAGKLARIGFIWLVALGVMLSRTRFGCLLQVKVGGRRVAHHTCLQVAVGACLGVFLGFAARRWHDGLVWWPWGAVAIAIVALTTVVAYAAEEWFPYGPCGVYSDKDDPYHADRESVGDKSTDGGSTDRAPSEIEMRDRSYGSGSE